MSFYIEFILSFLDVKPLLQIFIYLFIYLLQILFANVFFHPVGCLLILLIVSFAMEKLLGLIRSHLFVCLFDLRKLIQKILL